MLGRTTGDVWWGDAHNEDGGHRMMYKQSVIVLTALQPWSRVKMRKLGRGSMNPAPRNLSTPGCAPPTIVRRVAPSRSGLQLGPLHPGVSQVEAAVVMAPSSVLHPPCDGPIPPSPPRPTHPRQHLPAPTTRRTSLCSRRPSGRSQSTSQRLRPAARAATRRGRRRQRSLGRRRRSRWTWRVRRMPRRPAPK